MNTTTIRTDIETKRCLSSSTPSSSRSLSSYGNMLFGPPPPRASMVSDEDEHRIGFGECSWVVHKFGGTSVADADCYMRVANILEDQILIKKTNTNLAVVVSAMGGKPKVTDLLLDTVKYAAQRDSQAVERQLTAVLDKHRECLNDLFDGSELGDNLMDIIQRDIEDIRDILKTVSLMKWQAERISELVSGYGELWSAQILQSLMANRAQQRELDVSTSSLQYEEPTRHEFVYLDARRVITIDEEEAIQDGTVVWDQSVQKLHTVFRETKQQQKDPDSTNRFLHFIVTGYVACNTEGVSTTLKRDGSDFSAAIMGRLLRSNSINIWTDVDGVLSADPRRVPLAQVLAEVSYSEAMELAYFGAKVIHPKTMQPAIMSEPQIPIYIRNTFNAQLRGTRIFTSSPTLDRGRRRDRDKVVCGFTSIDGMALINVEGTGLVGVHGVDRRIFGALEHVGISAVLISQASSEHSVTLAVVETDAEKAQHSIQEEFARELRNNSVSNIDLQRPVSIIAAVGDGMLETTGVAGLFFSALGDAKINVLAIAQGCSERNISAVVRTHDSSRALRAVHAAFRLSHTTIRVAIVGMAEELGGSLLKLLNERRAALRATFELDLEVVVVMASSDSNELVCLKRDVDGGSDSITIDSFYQATGGGVALSAEQQAYDDGSEAVARQGGLNNLLEHLFRNECTNHVIFDCTNDEDVGKFHAAWLRAGVDVVTANNTGLSGPKKQRDEICHAEKALGRQSAKYLKAVTVGGGLPIINTARTLLETGDKIRRIDGILSVSISYIMFRMSPPPGISRCSDFDEMSSNGAFRGDLVTSLSASIGEACSFSQAVKEAVALGLMEEDPTKDLNNEYTSRVLMVLARELGIHDAETAEIQSSSDKLLEEKVGDFKNLSVDFDQKMKGRIEAARSRGCVLRQISSIDVREKNVEVKIVEVPEHHIFAINPPSCECVRFFTHRHRSYPLIVQGPSAGADSTASALLAELLLLMRGKASPRPVTLTRTDTSARLHSEDSLSNGID